MNDAQRAKVLDDLLAERETLARRWHKVLWRKRWEQKEEEPHAPRYFGPMVERFLTLLLQTQADPEAERRLGSELAAWCEVPEELIRSQELLTHYLGEHLSAEEAKALQPRLVRLFGEMATGFHNAKAEKKPSLLSHFFGHRSYDMLTPVNSVIGFSRVLLKGQDGPLTDLQRKDITTIYNSGQMLAQEIWDLRDLDKIEAGKMEVDREAFEMEKLIEHFRRPDIVPKERQLELLCDKSLRTIYGDPIRIRQVVLTLLSHSAHRAELGSTIRLAITRTTSDEKSYVHFRIVSPAPPTGMFAGLAEYQHLFAQGLDLVNVISRHWQLSLVLAHLFTRLMGGQIEMRESEEQGTILTLTLPIDKPEAPEPEEIPPLILMVDDEPAITHLYERYLRDGYRVAAYNDPRSFLDAVPSLDANLILLNLQMPEMDGFEVMGVLRAHPKSRDIPVVLCTTHPIEGIEERGLAAGASDFLQKPVLRQDLIRAVQRWAGPPSTLKGRYT